MHWNILDKKRYELLKKIVQCVNIDDYYMIGGTALSLQLRLRDSFDFDFCVPTEFNNEILLKELNNIGEIEVIENRKGTVDVILEGVQVSFFYYPNKIVGEFVETEDIPNLKMASVLDIAIMKIIAIGGRGAKKDFFDLYNIINMCDISIEVLAKKTIEKIGKGVNYANVVMGLSYFEDAENEVLPNTYVVYDWGKIKDFFIKFQVDFKKSLENLII